MNSIKDAISGLKPSKHISKVEKTEINELIETLDKIKYNKLIEELQKVVNSKKYTKTLNDKINKLIEKLNDNDDNISREEICDKIEKTIDEIKEIEEDNLEETLDKECHRYNKFTKSNPAEYINYNEKQNTYRLIRPDKKEKKSKKLLYLTEITKNEKSTKFKEKILKFCTFKNVMYKNKKFIIYLSKSNMPYFDLNHTINLISNDEDKINKFFNLENIERVNSYIQIANEKNITGVPFFDIGNDYISGAENSSNLASAIKNNLN